MAPHPPGTFVPADPNQADPDHMKNWNAAIQQALKNYGGAPGLYTGQLVLSASIQVTNPGSIIEYIAQFT